MKKKSLLLILLTTVLVISLVAFGACAEEGEEGPTELPPTASTSTLFDSMKTRFIVNVFLL